MNPPVQKLRLFCAPAVLAMFVFTPNVIAEEAEEKSLDLPTVEVTTTATDELGYIELEKEPNVGKLSVPLVDQPFSMSVIDENFMRDTGAKNIQDALQYTAGVYSGGFGPDTRGDSAKVRGLDPSLYLDGIRQDYGFYNSVRTNVYALESIEVLKGPSSVLYGQGELGGIVNSVSKLPKAEQQGEIWGQYGSHNRKQIAFDVTGPVDDEGKFLYRVVGLQRDAGTQVDHVEDDGYVIAPSFTWRPTEDTSFTLLFNRQEDKGQVSAQFLPQTGTLDPGPFGYAGSETFVGEPDWDKYDRKKTEVSFMADHNFNDSWKVSTTARYTDSSTKNRELWADIGPGVNPDGTVGRTYSVDNRSTRIFNLDANIEGIFDIGITKHTLLVGIDRQDALWKDGFSGSGSTGDTINLYDPQYGNLDFIDSIVLEDQDDNQIRQVGMYIADHMEIGPVVISAALRRDWAKNTLLALSGPNTTSDEDATTGRIGAMYRFDNGISPYVSYAEAFTMNLGTDGTGAGNTLEPTTGVQREYGFKFISNDKTLAISAAYFDIIQKNRIQQGDTPGGVEQTGAVVDGWELQINKRWNQFETQFSYTDLTAENDGTGERLPYVAEKIASWWNKYYINTNWRVGAGVRYIGNNVGNDYGFGAGPKVPSETLYDAMIGYAVGDWDFTVDAKNLTDEEFVSWCRGYVPGAVYDCGYGERRSVAANVRYSF